MKASAKGRGQPTKLTPEIQDAICDAIRSTKISITDAARCLGIHRDTINGWVNRGTQESSGIYFDFSVAVAAARAEGSRMLLHRMAEAGKDPKHWQACKELLAITEPQYAPRVRVQVEGQLKEAYERLKAAFANEPTVLERIISALAGESFEQVEAVNAAVQAVLEPETEE